MSQNKIRGLFFALAILCLLLTPSLANLTANSVLAWRHPVPGALYEVHGRAMHLYCSGNGSPTVVLEAGGGDDWLIWQKVQPEVAKTTRVCSHDRAGVGWSELQSGTRDAKHIAEELHLLLQQAGEKVPVVLVGASVGGFYIREFTAQYPADVAGLVFVDASTPEQVAAIPGSAYSSELIKRKHHEVMIEWWREASGWARLRGECGGDVPPGLEAYRDLARAEACRASYAKSWRGEADEFWHSAEEAAHSRCCGDLPLLVVSQDPENQRSGQPPNVRAIWNRLQDQLMTLSSQSRRIIARGSGHHVMLDRPDVVIRSIREVLAATATHRLDAAVGSTSME